MIRWHSNYWNHIDPVAKKPRIFFIGCFGELSIKIQISSNIFKYLGLKIYLISGVLQSSSTHFLNTFLSLLNCYYSQPITKLLIPSFSSLHFHLLSQLTELPIFKPFLISLFLPLIRIKELFDQVNLFSLNCHSSIMNSTLSVIGIFVSLPAPTTKWSAFSYVISLNMIDCFSELIEFGIIEICRLQVCVFMT